MFESVVPWDVGKRYFMNKSKDMRRVTDLPTFFVLWYSALLNVVVELNREK